MRALVLLAALLSGCTCGKSDASAGGEGGIADAFSAEVSIERPADVEQVWTDAKDGDEAELARLADREGPMGLVERSVDARYRLTALRAMGYTDGYVALPVLGNAAKSGPVEEATAATDSATALAAQKRRQVDPEDALELREGCDRLLESAKDPARPRPVRVGAVRALRMLTDSGCIKASDIPADVDVK
jgi:hypothetical protein